MLPLFFTNTHYAIVKKKKKIGNLIVCYVSMRDIKVTNSVSCQIKEEGNTIKSGKSCIVPLRVVMLLYLFPLTF